MENNNKVGKIVIAVLAVISIVIIIVIALGIGGTETPSASGNSSAAQNDYTSDDFTEETGGDEIVVDIPDDYNESDYIDAEADDTSSDDMTDSNLSADMDIAE